MKSILDFIFENAIALTILLIFASAILGAFLRARSRDRCLKDFHRYPVTVEEKGGDAVWGRLLVYSTGFELDYETEHHDDDGHIESSYVIYENEFGNLIALYRYHGQLDEALRRRRLKQIKRAWRPSLLRRFGRKLRNFFNTLRDAFAQSIDALIGTAKKTSKVMNSEGGRVSDMGKAVIGHFGNAYDPILERFIGQRVVVEMQKDGKALEYPGILKEYTAKFLEVVAVRLTAPAVIPLDAGTSPIKDVPVRRQDRTIVVENRRKTEIQVDRVTGRDFDQEINASVAPGSTAEYTLEKDDVFGAKLILRFPRDFDMVVPRATALVRHAGKRETVDWKSFLLGGGLPGPDA